MAPINYRLYLAVLVSVFLAVCTIYAIGFWLNQPERDFYPLLYAGLVILVTYSAALASRTRPYALDPLFLLGVTLLIGVILKIPYLIFNENARQHLLHNHDVSVFVDGAYLILVAMLAFLLGYLPLTRGSFANAKTYELHWNRQFACVVAGGVALTALAGALLVVREIGLDDLMDNFSRVRFVELSNVSDRLSSSLYLYYKIAMIAKISACASLVFLIFNRDRKSFCLIYIFIISCLISFMIPAILSARAASLILVCDIIAIIYFSGLTIKIRYLVSIAAFGFAMFAFTTHQRLVVTGNSATTLEWILGHQYLLDLTKTSLIAWYVDFTGFRFSGETLIGWLFLPIPDSIVPYNPLFMDLGQWIGDNVYCSVRLSIPAGYVAELYLNFGWTGVISGMFLTGVFMAGFWRWVIPRVTHPVILVFGAMLTLRFAVFLFNNDLGTFVLKNLIETVPTALAVFACVVVKARDCRGESSTDGPAKALAGSA